MTTSPTEVLAFGLRTSIGDRRVLDGIDLSMSGGLTTILGPNGAGKSTLLRILATVLVAEQGSLLLDGLDPRHETDRIEARRRVGYLPQDPGLDGASRVFDLLDYLAVLKDLGDARRRRWMIGDALERVGLSERAGDRVGELSGGMKRRLGLAQSILGAPGLLLLDEPAAGLDPDERARLRDLVTERRGRSTVVVSTHLTSEAEHSDRIVVLDAGVVRFVGTPDRLVEVARGRTWVQEAAPSGQVRASWHRADGSVRCLGDPPSGAELVASTLEDGYLLSVGDASLLRPAAGS